MVKSKLMLAIGAFQVDRAIIKQFPQQVGNDSNIDDIIARL